VNPDLYDLPAAAVDALRQRLGWKARRVILFGGGSTAKGRYQLLAALRRVKRAVPDVAAAGALTLLRLYPAVDPRKRRSGLRDGLRRLARRRGTGGRYRWRMSSPRRRSVSTRSPPSISKDGRGHAAITTCFGGAREAVLDGKTGFIVNPYNTDALADRLNRLLTDESLRQCMAAAGRERIRQQFTLDHQVSTMLHIYERALAKRHRRGS